MVDKKKTEEKIVIFGASTGGRRAYGCRKRSQTVVAFADNDTAKQGQRFCGKPVIAPQRLDEINYDRIIIACQSAFQVYLQLSRLGIHSQKVAVVDEDVLLGDYEISTVHLVLLLMAGYGSLRLVLDGIDLFRALFL